MKTTQLIAITFLVLYSACTASEANPKTDKVAFGIFETIRKADMPVKAMEALIKNGIQDEKNDQQPMIGYMEKKSSVDLSDLSTETSVKLLRTAYTVDNEHKYVGIVAVQSKSLLDNTMIQKAVAVKNNVEIRFNLEGAKLWAEMTRKNTGKVVALVIDGEVYALPYVNAEIRNGMAMITGLENEELAKKLADRLNDE
jgi:preprotein translocase subunit SecD